MLFDDAAVASGDSRDLVQEAINNAQADLVKSQSTLHNIAFQESISDPCPSPESKKKCVITADSTIVRMQMMIHYFIHSTNEIGE